MPRTKKAAGTAVDRRNGRRAGLEAAEQLRKFGLPRRDGREWSAETRKSWNLLWRDPVASLWSLADRQILLRWADAIDRYWWAIVLADAEPESEGSMGQTIENPLYGVADKAIRVAERCEAQLGVGALNRAKLGVETASATKSLMDLNAALAEGGDDDDDDPR